MKSDNATSQRVSGATRKGEDVSRDWKGIWRKPRRGRGRSLTALLPEAVEGGGAVLERELEMKSVRSPVAARALARLLMKEERFAKASETLVLAQARFPSDEGLKLEAALCTRRRWAPVQRGFAHLADKDPSSARRAFLAAMAEIGERVPLDGLPRVLVGIGWAERDLGHPAIALAAFLRAHRVDATAFEPLFGAGLALRDLGREEEARIRLAQAAHRNRLASAPLAFIGWCHYELGRWEAAERAFRAARRVGPQDPEVLWGAAWCAWRRGDDTLALDRFRDALARASHRSLDDLAELILHDEAFRELAEDLARAARRDGRGALALDAARRAGARELEASLLLEQDSLEDVLALEGATLPFVRARLRAALRLKDGERALAEANRLPDPERSVALGEAHLLMGDEEAALEAWARGAAEGEPDALHRRAELLRRRARRPLLAFEEASPPVAEAEGAIAREAVLVAQARRLARSGDVPGALARLEGLSGPSARACREEIVPTPEATTGRGHLAARLAGLRPRGRPPRDSWGRCARYLARPSRRTLGRLRRVLQRYPDDPLIQAAFRVLDRKLETR